MLSWRTDGALNCKYSFNFLWPFQWKQRCQTGYLHKINCNFLKSLRHFYIAARSRYHLHDEQDSTNGKTKSANNQKDSVLSFIGANFTTRMALSFVSFSARRTQSAAYFFSFFPPLHFMTIFTMTPLMIAMFSIFGKIHKYSVVAQVEHFIGVQP